MKNTNNGFETYVRLKYNILPPFSNPLDYILTYPEVVVLNAAKRYEEFYGYRQLWDLEHYKKYIEIVVDELCLYELEIQNE